LLASDVSELATLSEEWFPLILKATYGDNSQGLRLARQPEDVWDVHWPEPLVLAQHYVPNSGYDLKLYVCGERVFATRKPSPFNRDAQARPQPLRAEAEMIELALRCGRAFGLEIYGVDTVEGPDGLAVIEVNEFPNFTAVPGAAVYVAEVILGGQGAGLAHPVAVRQVAG
jgi:ribosomal protein S6--L-glutamate ligase